MAIQFDRFDMLDTRLLVATTNTLAYTVSDQEHGEIMVLMANANASSRNVRVFLVPSGVARTDDHKITWDVPLGKVPYVTPWLPVGPGVQIYTYASAGDVTSVVFGRLTRR